MDSLQEDIARVSQRIMDIRSRMRQLGLSDSADPETGFAQYLSRADQPATSSSPKALNGGQLDDLISRAAATYQLSPALLQAVCTTESGGDPLSVSPKGAQGLMQLMPSTSKNLGITDPFNPEQNIMGGAQYLRQQLDRFDGDVPKALAAYNAGPGAVTRYGGVPPYPETQQYVEKVLSLIDNQK